jgi:hypothetical protein
MDHVLTIMNEFAESATSVENDNVVRWLSLILDAWKDCEDEHFFHYLMDTCIQLQPVSNVVIFQERTQCFRGNDLSITDLFIGYKCPVDFQTVLSTSITKSLFVKKDHSDEKRDILKPAPICDFVALREHASKEKKNYFRKVIIFHIIRLDLPKWLIIEILCQYFIYSNL